MLVCLGLQTHSHGQVANECLVQGDLVGEVLVDVGGIGSLPDLLLVKDERKQE